MNEKIMFALMGILIALGGWNLSQTFDLSKDMVLLKEKVSNIEEDVKNHNHRKKKRNN
tara:strand:- start:1 stop:174 length:174 start_codon:yes stop_codon:yes gene_type:complete